ncbi:MAG: hypothetical protein P8Q35_04035 [Candidatus Thalassarchaeaceae archaeon]|nr:hypothetical protein [Candidatus Thalassarchaeaceae archaeon]
MQARRRLQALGLVLILALSSTAAPASAQADDPKQPSVDNPHMHIWGTEQLDQCWTHFDQNDSAGSSSLGYGEKTFSQSQQVEVDYNCRIESGQTFKEDMYLNNNGTILIELTFQISSADCQDNSECKNLTITLSRGIIDVAQHIIPVESINGGTDESVRWEIPVNETMYRWNKSGEEPSIRIEYSAPGDSGLGCGLIFDCDGLFRMYFSNNEDNHSVEVNFPVVNKTEPGTDGGNGGGIGGAVDDALPGFGLAAGVAALAMAAVAAGSRPRKE